MTTLRSVNNFSWILVFLVIAAPSLVYPFGRDQSEYACIAWLLIQGKHIYSEVINVKPPGTHLLHTVAILMFGQSMISIRILDLAYQGLTAHLIFRIIAIDNGSKWLATAGAILFASFYYSFNYWHTAQTDGFQPLLLLSSVILLSSANAQKSLVAGVLIGLAGLFKYPMLIFLCLAAVFARHTPTSKVNLVALFTGALLVFIFFIATLLATNSWSAFLDTITVYFGNYYSSATEGFQIPNLFPREWLKIFILVCSGVFLTGALLSPNAIALRLTSLAGMAAVIQVVLQGKLYDYHLLPLLAPFAIVVPCLLHISMTRRRLVLRFSIALIIGTIVAVLAQAQLLHAPAWKLLYAVVTGRESIRDVWADPYFGGYNNGQDYSIRANLEVAEFIVRHTTPRDLIFIWGFEPGVYFLSGRQPSSRFIFNYLQFETYSSGPYISQLLDDLTTQPPAYILLVKNDRLPWVTGSSDDSLSEVKRIEAFSLLLSENYGQEGQIEDFEIYKRRS